MIGYYALLHYVHYMYVCMYVCMYRGQWIHNVEQLVRRIINLYIIISKSLYHGRVPARPHTRAGQCAGQCAGLFPSPQITFLLSINLTFNITSPYHILGIYLMSYDLDIFYRGDDIHSRILSTHNDLCFFYILYMFW